MRFDQNVVRSADHDEMLDIVAPDEHQLTLPVEAESVDEAEPRLARPPARNAQPMGEREPVDDRDTISAAMPQTARKPICKARLSANGSSLNHCMPYPNFRRRRAATRLRLAFRTRSACAEKRPTTLARVKYELEALARSARARRSPIESARP